MYINIFRNAYDGRIKMNSFPLSTDSRGRPWVHLSARARKDATAEVVSRVSQKVFALEKKKKRKNKTQQ